MLYTLICVRLHEYQGIPGEPTGWLVPVHYQYHETSMDQLSYRSARLSSENTQTGQTTVTRKGIYNPRRRLADHLQVE